MKKKTQFIPKIQNSSQYLKTRISPNISRSVFTVLQWIRNVHFQSVITVDLSFSIQQRCMEEAMMADWLLNSTQNNLLASWSTSQITCMPLKLRKCDISLLFSYMYALLHICREFPHIDSKQAPRARFSAVAADYGACSPSETALKEFNPSWM